MTNYIKQMEVFQAALDAVNNAREGGNEQQYRWYIALFNCLGSAWDNANDTVADGGIEDTQEEKARIAYGSICMTPDFESNELVRDWFTALGYRW